MAARYNPTLPGSVYYLILDQISMHILRELAITLLDASSVKQHSEEFTFTDQHSEN